VIDPVPLRPVTPHVRFTFSCSLAPAFSFAD
jgi:hypothetical protein